MSEFTVERKPANGKASTKTGTLGATPKRAKAAVQEDPYDALWTNRTVDPARVSINISHSEDFGAIKVSANVTLNCDQNEPTINRAGELAFLKARELMEDSWAEITK